MNEGEQPMNEHDQGHRIKQLREAAGMTLEQVAVRSGTTFQQVQRLETGHRRLTIEWMRRIATALGVSMTALLPDANPDHREYAQNQEELGLLRYWRLLNSSERAMIAALMRDKGVEIR